MPNKKPKISQLKKKADKEFSLYIRYRDGEQRPDGWWTQCITCEQWLPLKQMQNGHFVKRSVNSLRYDEFNCNGQCYVCNVLRYGEQYLYATNIDKKYGDGTADALMARRFETHKLTIDELQKIIEDSKQYVLEVTTTHN